MFPWIVWLLLSAVSLAQSWPKSIQPKIHHSRTSLLPPDGKSVRYQTKHFIISSPVVIDSELLKNFTQTIESVPVVLRAIPLPIFSPPRGERASVHLCRNEEEFIISGGPPGAAGFYSGRKRRIILRSEYFLSEAGKIRPDYDLLIHEFTHLCMHQHLWKHRPWFYEGVAEYLASAHTHKGSYRFSQIETSIKDHIRRRAPASENRVILPKLDHLVELTPRQWHEMVSTQEPKQVANTYFAALLLVHYHFHGGKERRETVASYLEQIANIEHKRQELPQLVEAEQAKHLHTKLRKYWAPRGLQLQFR